MCGSNLPISRKLALGILEQSGGISDLGIRAVGPVAQRMAPLSHPPSSGAHRRVLLLPVLLLRSAARQGGLETRVELRGDALGARTGPSATSAWGAIPLGGGISTIYIYPPSRLAWDSAVCAPVRMLSRYLSPCPAFSWGAPGPHRPCCPGYRRGGGEPSGPRSGVWVLVRLKKRGSKRWTPSLPPILHPEQSLSPILGSVSPRTQESRMGRDSLEVGVDRLLGGDDAASWGRPI